MALVDLNLEPTHRQLRQFGFISLAAIPLVTWFWGGEGIVLGIAAGLGLVFATLGYLAPALLKWPFIGLSLISWPIGFVVGEAVMLFLYFVVFLSFGLWFRLIGRDALKLRIDRNQESYWEDRPPQRKPQDYYRQS
ncbi:MAG: hypothetical protein KDA66_00250 [Planctomycetaceae bacterium]|nr:hypothetical protein [Planctomycetaceae bacterium]